MYKKKIIAVTQCFPCGSWLSIEKILDVLATSGFEVIILGLGELQSKNPKFKYHVIPYLAFNKFGDITTRSPILNFLWNLPLIVGGLILTALQKPTFVTYNGLATGLTLAPLVRVFGPKSIIMYHTFIGEVTNKALLFLLKLLGKSVDIVVVNSQGSGKDAETFIEKKKIVINEHFADDVFFSNDSKETNGGNTLTIAYAGRIDEDKLCFPLVHAAKKMYKEHRTDIQFNFAGAGKDANVVETLAKNCPNIHYFGYIKERKELKQFYNKADVIWAFADETYLALPAIEALACGKPILIPKYAAISGSKKLVNESLVPNDVGWLVDTNDENSVINLLDEISKNKYYLNMNNACIKLASEKYSKKNVEVVAEEIIALAKSNDE